MIRRLNSLPEVEPPAMLWQGVVARLALQSSKARSASFPVMRRSRLTHLWGAGVVLACLAILWATLLPQLTGTPHDAGPAAFRTMERPPSQPLMQSLPPQRMTSAPQQQPFSITPLPPPAPMVHKPPQTTTLPQTPRNDVGAQNPTPAPSPQDAPSAQSKPVWVTDETCGGRGWIPCPGPAGWTTVNMAVKCEGGRVVCLLHFGDNCPICNDMHGKTCPVCKGAGRIVCPICQGTGKVLATPLPHPHLSDE